jgi:hypothetical protein
MWLAAGSRDAPEAEYPPEVLLSRVSLNPHQMIGAVACARIGFEAGCVLGFLLISWWAARIFDNLVGREERKNL